MWVTLAHSIGESLLRNLRICSAHGLYIKGGYIAFKQVDIANFCAI